MKSLAKNSVYNIIYKCSNLVFPLIISAYVSRILLAEGIGKVSSAQNIVTYFTLLAALGLPTYGTKVVAAHGNTRESRSKVFSELFCINAVSTTVCTILYYLMVFEIPYFQQRKELSIVCGLAIVFNIINVDWFYQGREEYGYIMIRSVIVKIASLLAIFVLVKDSNDFLAYAVIVTLSKVVNNIYNIIHLRKYATLTFSGLNIRKHIKPVVVFLAASIAIEIYTLADTTMLTFIHGDAVVGYYTTARKGIDVIRTMLTAICAVFLPRLSYYYANGEKKLFNELVNKGIKILTYMTVPAMVGVILTADYFVPLLFGADFSEAITTTKILSFSLITVAFSNFFGYQVLVTIGKEKEMLISTIVGAIINVGLNFLLVFSFKHNGVAVASAITEFCVTLYQLWSIRKNVVFDVPKKFVISTLTGTVFMAIAVIICEMIIKSELVCIFIAIFVGVIAYVLTSYFMGNEITIEICRKINNYVNFHNKVQLK